MVEIFPDHRAMAQALERSDQEAKKLREENAQIYEQRDALVLLNLLAAKELRRLADMLERGRPS